MKRAVALLGVLLVSVGLLAAVAPAAAQEATATPTAAPDAGASNASTVVERVDDEGVVVTGYRYNATTETFFVELRNDGDDDADVTITEAISREDAGERRFGISVVEVEDGETVTTSLSAKRVDGAAGVMILTEAAIDSGTGVYLQENNKKDTRLIKGGATGGDVRAGVLFAGFGSVLLMIAGAWQYVASENQEVVDADLDPSVSLLGKFRGGER